MSKATDTFSFVLLDENNEPFLEMNNELQMIMALRLSQKKFGFAKGETWYYRQGEDQPYKKTVFVSDFM